MPRDAATGDGLPRYGRHYLRLVRLEQKITAQPAPPLPPEPTGFIFDIQGFSVHDGPGCRTVVFLGGCPLRCHWCSNPEGQEQKNRLLHRQRLCRACGRCATTCAHGAIQFTDSGAMPQIERSACNGCDTFACISRCWSGALTQSGRAITASELMALLNRDRNFWGGDGGVTFSGGEPLMQPAFLEVALQRCHDAHIHTAAETCGHVDSAVLKSTLPLLDWLFFDIKHLDSAPHRHATGVDNRLILANLKTIAATTWHGRLMMRLTVIPDFNDSADHVQRLGKHLHALGIAEIQLLPLHRLGLSKYTQLGLPNRMPDIAAPSAAAMASHRAILAETGLTVHLENDAPF